MKKVTLIGLFILCSCATTMPMTYVASEITWFGDEVHRETLRTYKTEEECKEALHGLKKEARQMNPLGPFIYVCDGSN